MQSPDSGVESPSSGVDPEFLREGVSQAGMIDVQSQKSAEELPNMHASTNWVSWQGTNGLLTALIEHLIVLLEYLKAPPKSATALIFRATRLPLVVLMHTIEMFQKYHEAILERINI